MLKIFYAMSDAKLCWNLVDWLKFGRCVVRYSIGVSELGTPDPVLQGSNDNNKQCNNRNRLGSINNYCFSNGPIAHQFPLILTNLALRNHERLPLRKKTIYFSFGSAICNSSFTSCSSFLTNFPFNL